jgi:hypothetical protein
MKRATNEAEALTVKDIARLDRCSEKTVRRAITAGDLEVIRIGPGGRRPRALPAAHDAYRRGRRT